MKKNCSHEDLLYSVTVENAERIAGTKIILIKGPTLLRGKCDCGYETKEIMMFGIYGDI